MGTKRVLASPKFGAVGYTYILDQLSVQPWAAWSTRQLRKAYNGPCLRLENISNDTGTPTASMDIGFAANHFWDYVAAQAFVNTLPIGSRGFFAAIIYDQSGNGRNLRVTSNASIDPVNGPSVFAQFTDLNGAVLNNITLGPTVKFIGNEVSGTFGTGTAYFVDLSVTPLSATGTWTHNQVMSYEAVNNQESAMFNCGFAGNTLLGGSRLLGGVPFAFGFDGAGGFHQTAGAGSAIPNGATKAVTAIRSAGALETFQNLTGSGQVIIPTLNALQSGGMYFGRNAGAFGSYGLGDNIIWGTALGNADFLKLVNNQIAFWGITP